jgi:ABC-type antimicrobial peptide transport system permease subunit
MASLLFEVEAGDPITLGAAGLVLAAVGVLAAWVPARRASRFDPVRALRVE